MLAPGLPPVPYLGLTHSAGAPAPQQCLLQRLSIGKTLGRHFAKATQHHCIQVSFHRGGPALTGAGSS